MDVQNAVIKVDGKDEEPGTEEGFPDYNAYLEIEKETKEGTSVGWQEKISVVNEKICKSRSSNNIFLELPFQTRHMDKSGDSLSDSDGSIIFCSDPEFEFSSIKINKPKDILSEVSEILLSLSDDERFLKCVNYSNTNGLPPNNNSTVDIIFTYNILSVLYCKLKELKDYFDFTRIENKKLLKENHIAEAEHVAYQVQVETLQQVIDKQQEEIKTLNSKLKYQESLRTSDKQTASDDLKLVKRKLDETIREKDSAVMKYAKNESELINIRKEKENLVRRLKNIDTERDDSVKKIKILTNEKTSTLNNLESKKTELKNALKEISILRDELNCQDIKSKWVQENLQIELSRCKEKNIKLQSEINELKKLIGTVTDNNENLNNEDENNSKLCNGGDLDYVSEDKMIDQKGGSKIEDVYDLKQKIEKLENEKVEYETILQNLKETNSEHTENIELLQGQLAEMETLRSTLKQIQENLSLYQTEIERLKEENDELRQDMECSREREAEMLNFTEKLTAKNVTIQSELAVLEAKKAALEADKVPIDERVHELEDKVTLLTHSLEKEMLLKEENCKKLNAQIEVKNEDVEILNAKLEEQQAENQSLKHKYISTIRELTKEVQQHRKCKKFEVTESSSISDSVDLDSRTSSCNSLNEPQLPKLEPDRQTLIERIVKLQKVHARNVEKIEFLEEHISQLILEIKKKNRVIQHYVLREQSGVLSSEIFDQHKAELSKYGGIMASLYNSKCDDNPMSPELGLEINRKLQAVLEDTILKNITLKENIETLGREIARLTTGSTSNQC